MTVWLLFEWAESASHAGGEQRIIFFGDRSVWEASIHFVFSLYVLKNDQVLYYLLLFCIIVANIRLFCHVTRL